MTTDKLVSVIIPCYNSALYIEETLQSVENQTYNNIEIIVVDDGSTDNTPEILEQVATSNSKIKYIQQPNKGQTIARQTGVEKSLGEYLLFLDSDDKIAPTYIEKAINILNENSDIGIVTCKAKYFEKYNKEWKLKPFQLTDFLIKNMIFITSLIRREDFEKVGGFDTELTHFEDWELFISIVKLGRKVHRIPEFLFYYRKRNDETSVTDKSDRDKNILSHNILKIYLKHYDFYQKNGLDIAVLFDHFKYKEKYYNAWYRKYFYKFFKPKKYKYLYSKDKA